MRSPSAGGPPPDGPDWEPRENDCSKGFGSRSKLDLFPERRPGRSGPSAASADFPREGDLAVGRKRGKNKEDGATDQVCRDRWWTGVQAGRTVGKRGDVNGLYSETSQWQRAIGVE